MGRVAASGRSSRAGRAGQEAALDEHLEPVADAQDQPVGGQELLDHVGQVMDQLVGEDFAGGDVVAVTETTGDRQNLVIRQALRVLDEPVDVHALGQGARLFPGELGLGVAIRPGGS